ncbi:hypothetical protein [Arthrobacter sp. SPG23]|uniref:hypothetical protein n=1 Tax=Arthrobacter sp. SPG23 TaxID=1610703 RepID=UPI000AA0E871
MTADTTALAGSVQMRALEISDAGRLSAAYRLNRDHLAPWEPARSDSFFTAVGQRAAIESKLALLLRGRRFLGSS